MKYVDKLREDIIKSLEDESSPPEIPRKVFWITTCYNRESAVDMVRRIMKDLNKRAIHWDVI